MTSQQLPQPSFNRSVSLVASDFRSHLPNNLDMVSNCGPIHTPTTITLYFIYNILLNNDPGHIDIPSFVSHEQAMSNSHISEAIDSTADCSLPVPAPLLYHSHDFADSHLLPQHHQIRSPRPLQLNSKIAPLSLFTFDFDQIEHQRDHFGVNPSLIPCMSHSPQQLLDSNMIHPTDQPLTVSPSRQQQQQQQQQQQEHRLSFSTFLKSLRGKHTDILLTFFLRCGFSLDVDHNPTGVKNFFQTLCASTKTPHSSTLTTQQSKCWTPQSFSLYFAPLYTCSHDSIPILPRYISFMKFYPTPQVSQHIPFFALGGCGVPIIPTSLFNLIDPISTSPSNPPPPAATPPLLTYSSKQKHPRKIDDIDTINDTTRPPPPLSKLKSTDLICIDDGVDGVDDRAAPRNVASDSLSLSQNTPTTNDAKSQLLIDHLCSNIEDCPSNCIGLHNSNNNNLATPHRVTIQDVADHVQGVFHHAYSHQPRSTTTSVIDATSHELEDDPASPFKYSHVVISDTKQFEYLPHTLPATTPFHTSSNSQPRPVICSGDSLVIYYDHMPFVFQIDLEACPEFLHSTTQSNFAQINPCKCLYQPTSHSPCLRFKFSTSQFNAPLTSPNSLSHLNLSALQLTMTSQCVFHQGQFGSPIYCPKCGQEPPNPSTSASTSHHHKSKPTFTSSRLFAFNWFIDAVSSAFPNPPHDNVPGLSLFTLSPAEQTAFLSAQQLPILPIAESPKYRHTLSNPPQPISTLEFPQLESAQPSLPQPITYLPHASNLPTPSSPSLDQLSLTFAQTPSTTSLPHYNDNGDNVDFSIFRSPSSSPTLRPTTSMNNNTHQIQIQAQAQAQPQAYPTPPTGLTLRIPSHTTSTPPTNTNRHLFDAPATPSASVISDQVKTVLSLPSIMFETEPPNDSASQHNHSDHHQLQLHQQLYNDQSTHHQHSETLQPYSQSQIMQIKSISQRYSIHLIHQIQHYKYAISSAQFLSNSHLQTSLQTQSRPAQPQITSNEQTQLNSHNSTYFVNSSSSATSTAVKTILNLSSVHSTYDLISVHIHSLLHNCVDKINQLSDHLSSQRTDVENHSITGIIYAWCPIQNYSTPSLSQLLFICSLYEANLCHFSQLQAASHQHRPIAVLSHCIAGLGRTGCVNASFLVYKWYQWYYCTQIRPDQGHLLTVMFNPFPDSAIPITDRSDSLQPQYSIARTAIRYIRSSRAGSIETVLQEECVAQFELYLQQNLDTTFSNIH